MHMMVEVDTPSDDELMTLREAVDAYGLSIHTLRDHIHVGRIPSWKLGQVLKIRRVDAEALRDRLRTLQRNG